MKHLLMLCDCIVLASSLFPLLHTVKISWKYVQQFWFIALLLNKLSCRFHHFCIICSKGFSNHWVYFNLFYYTNWWNWKSRRIFKHTSPSSGLDWKEPIVKHTSYTHVQAC